MGAPMLTYLYEPPLNAGALPQRKPPDAAGVPVSKSTIAGSVGVKAAHIVTPPPPPAPPAAPPPAPPPGPPPVVALPAEPAPGVMPPAAPPAPVGEPPVLPTVPAVGVLPLSSSPSEPPHETMMKIEPVRATKPKPVNNDEERR